MKVVYSNHTFPDAWPHAIFLAGPTPRDPETPSWRPEALKELEALGYGGVVFIPEEDTGDWKGAYTDQVEWEKAGLGFADKIVFWVPRNLRTMPALTTNIEFGQYVDSGKAVLGFPEGTPKMRYLEWLAADVPPDVPVLSTLKETLEAAIEGWDKGNESTDHDRMQGERYVPKDIWDTPMFQSWYHNLKSVDNRLDEAKVLWAFRMPRLRSVFSYVLWVKVWIEAEERFKENEWVFARTDIGATVLYRNPHPDEFDVLDTEIVLVKEFRSPGRTPDGFIHELPGGSCEGNDDSARVSAAREVYEETGIAIPDDRFRYIGSRQPLGILSTHKAHCFAVELTEDEMVNAKKLADSNTTFGEEQDSELTYVEVVSVKDLFQREDSDWTTLGIVMRAITQTY